LTFYHNLGKLKLIFKNSFTGSEIIFVFLTDFHLSSATLLQYFAKFNS